MIKWVIGIGVWFLLVAVGYLFFRRKLQDTGEIYGEDTEDEYADDYDEYEEYGESAWAENSGEDWEESSQDEDYWEDNAQNGSWDENSRDEGSWDGEAGEDLQVYYMENTVPRRKVRVQTVLDDGYIEDFEDRNGKKSGRKTGIFGWLAMLLVLAGAVYLVLPYYCVRNRITINAGEKCPGVEAFLKWENMKAAYVSEINENTLFNRAGDYGVIINVYGREVAAVLHVEGTVEPHIATKNVAILCGGSVRADDFVEKVEGITPVVIRFAKEPDCMTGGINTVLLEIEDEVGNVTTAEAFLEVIEDKEPPVIHGVGELTMTVGGSISYKRGITVTDNYDQNVKLEVDSSAVNVDKVGDYRVIYSAVDSAGNRTSVSTILHVEPMTLDTVTEESIYTEADKLLAKILTDSMSQYDQAKAIYDWCHDNIAYSDSVSDTNWVRGAYRGLVNRKGDCYVYAATAKCLLTRAGIQNMDIEKIPTELSLHYWNLIDIGEGWHHFDTCRRKDGSTFFYKTDKELMEYSDAHDKSHNYDRSMYPEIK